MKARTVLRPLAGAAVVLVAVPAALLLALVFQPQRFLTAETVGRAVRVFGSGFSPRWSRLDFSVRSPDVFEKEFSLSTADFCFAKADGSLSGCLKSLDARFTLEFATTGVRVGRIALLDVRGGEISVDETKGAPRAAGKGGFDPYRLPRLLPAFLRGVRIDRISADVPSFSIADASAATKGRLTLGFDPARADPLGLDARWTDAGRDGSVHRGRARLSAVSDFFKTGQLTFVDAKGSIEEDGVSARFSARARQAGADAVSVTAEASGRREGLRFKFAGHGVQTPERYRLRGGLSVEASSGPLKSVRLEPFDFTASRAKGAAIPESLRLEGALRAEPVDFRPVRGFTPPRFIGGRLVLNARSTPTFLQKDRFDADLSVLLNPYLSWYEARVDLLAKASGRLSELPLLQVQQRIDADVNVPRFKDVVDFLAGGPFAVPAPLDALEGGLRLTFTERGDPKSDLMEFDSTARGDLAGAKQKLRFHIAGKGTASRLLTKDRRIEASVAATLDDVALQLPHLDALKMPAMTLDPRIKSARTRAADREAQASRRRAEVLGSTSAVALELSVDTARPIVLYSDLAKSPIPVALALKFRNVPGGEDGTVGVKAFDVEFFRRKATVDHLNLTFRAGSKQVDLDGLVKYKAPEAQIDIRLLGTVDKPQVVFESDPPMNQSDIVAMLVFGKSPDDLDTDQTATVSNTQTAMSDEAFGLASLYLFASTPIQYVGYDPAEKAYTMKFRIPGGETLEVNSDFDTTKSVQLRKRLSRHFAIVTEAVESQTQGNGVITMLEWFARY